MPKNQAARKLTGDKNPLTVLIKILANALLEDPHGINCTANNALMVLAGLVHPDLPEEIGKRVVEDQGRCRYED